LAVNYEAFIRLTMVESVAGALALIITRLGLAEGGVKRLETAMSTLNRTSATLGGALSVAFGVGIVKGVVDMAEAASKLSHELAQIHKMGFSPAQEAAAKASIMSMPTQVRGSTSLGAAKIFEDVALLLSPDVATRSLKALTEFTTNLAAIKDVPFEEASKSLFSLVRAGDLLGKMVDPTATKLDPERMTAFLNLASKVALATHGKVGPEQWLGLAQQGGPALSSMSDEGLMSMAMAAQAMGGMRAGTAMTSLYQQMVGGKMTQYSAQGLQDMGLVGGYSVNWGGHLTWDKGALDTPFTQAMQKDPLVAAKMLQDAMVAHGFKTIDEQIPELFKVLGRQTTQRLVHDFVRNYPQMISERGRMEQVAGTLDSNMISNTQDFERVMVNLKAAFEDMKTKIGLPITEILIPSLNKLGDALTKIGTFASAHPDSIRQIGEGISLLGLAFIGGGGVALFAAMGPAGWLAAGVIALGTACFTNKDAIKSYLEWFVGGINSLMNSGIEKLGTFMTDVAKGIVVLGSALDSLWDKIKGGLGSLFSHASFTQDGGDSSSALSAGERAKYASLIKQFGGSETSNLLKIYGTEGAGGYVGDGGSSFGPFQLHYGGMAGGSNRFAGMGEQFTRDTGLDARNPSTVAAQVQWMAKYGHKHGGYSSDVWHGLRGHGGSLKSGGPPVGQQDAKLEIHVHSHLDGREVAHSVERQFASAAAFPRSAPYFDSSRGFASPDHGFATT
jgi:hypothetical protein